MVDRVHVEVAWEVDPLTRPDPGDWVRLGTVDPKIKIESLDTARGVNLKTGQIEAGEARATISDQNGNLDPSNAAAEWAPNVLPRRRVRFVVEPGAGVSESVEWDGEPVEWDGEPIVWGGDFGESVLWTGFIRALPIQWRREVQWTTLTAAGITWLLSEMSLPLSVTHGETLALAPLHYWPLAETSGTVAEDVAGTLDASYRLGAKGERLLPYADGGQLFASFNQEDKLTPVVIGPSFTSDTEWTFAVWFQAVTNYPQDDALSGSVYAAALVSLDTGDSTFLDISVGTNSTGRGRVEVYLDDASDFQWRGSFGVNVLDGAPHLIVARCDGGELAVLVDGVDVTEALSESGTPSPSITGKLRFGNALVNEEFPELASLYPLRWRSGHVAYWDLLLSDADALTLYEAGAYAWGGDLTGARLGRVLDLVGIDVADRDIDTGTQICAPTLLNGENVMAYIAKIAATEGGPVGEDANGRIFLRERIANAPVVAGTFSDDPDGDGGFAVAPLDPDFSLDRVVNIAKVTRENGVTQEATAATSVATYGPKTASIDSLHQTPSGSRSAGARLTIRNHDPRLVFPSVLADSIDTPPTVLLDTDIGDAVDVIARPPRGGDPIEQTSIVERVEHTMHARTSWKARFGVVEHTTLPDFWWDEPGQGWDESVWVAP